jgi:hypothetical protein
MNFWEFEVEIERLKVEYERQRKQLGTNVIFTQYHDLTIAKALLNLQSKLHNQEFELAVAKAIEEQSSIAGILNRNDLTIEYGREIVSKAKYLGVNPRDDDGFREGGAEKCKLQ